MNRTQQLTELAGTFMQSGGIRAFLRWRPFSITAFRMLRVMKREGYHFNTILDGGANKGQFARAATETYPEALIVAFEPLPDVVDELRKNLADRNQVTVVESALGSHGGRIEFYRHRYSLASSALPVAATAADNEIEKITVPVCQLDEVLRSVVLRPPVLLKLDLQGYEVEALRGATNVLPQIQYVLLETSFEPKYVDEPGFPEVFEFMRDAGFTFVRPLDVLRDNRDTITQMDALFIRRP